jgi:hypothetical protein
VIILRIVCVIGYIAVRVARDLLDAAAYFAAVALLTALLALLLPLAAAFAVSLLGVSVCFGYRRARQIEQARMRGEW